MTTANPSTEKMTTLSVRAGTKRAVDALKSAYMRRHGRTISDDKVVQALAAAGGVDVLPAPDQAPAEKVETHRRKVNKK